MPKSEIDHYVLQGKYFGEWEDLTADETLKGARDSQKDYARNEPETPTRIQVEFKSGRRRNID